MQTVGQFAERCLKVAAVAKTAQTVMVRAAALAVTTAERAEIRSATKGSMRLSGVGARGASVGAGFVMLSIGDRPAAAVSARGPLHLLERDTKAHVIVPKRRRALRTPNGAFSRVQSKGTKGKHPWEKGVVAGLLVADKAASAGASKAILKAVTG